MKPNKIKIQKLKENPDNPRILSRDKFRKLVNSLKEFPQMLKLRPIVVDEDNIILGGNMRYKAALELGLSEVWVIQADDLTKDQKAEFIIKDNAGFGKWDWETLANDWSMEVLTDWGVDVVIDQDDIAEMNNPNNMNTENVFATELDMQSNYIVLKFNNDIDWIQAKTLFELKTETARRQNGKAWSQGIGRVVDGVKAIKKIKE